MQYEDRITIPTPEGVSLELTLAGLGSRAIAGAVDLALKAVAVAVLLIVFVAAVGAGGLLVFVPLAGMTMLVYDVLFETLGGGRTPGKRLAGLRVVRTSGRPVDLTASVIRNALRLGDGLALSYVPTMVSIIVTRRNQRPGDLAADTVVIRERREIDRAWSDEATPYVPAAEQAGRRRRRPGGRAGRHRRPTARPGTSAPSRPRTSRPCARSSSAAAASPMPPARASPRSSTARCARASAGPTNPIPSASWRSSTTPSGRGARRLGMDLGLTGKACIVTGATRGIGLATAQMLHAEGARVLAVARTGDDTFHADVTDPEDAAAIVAACVERYGTVDALVNNAGTSFVRSLEELSDHDWQSQWELHVMGPMRLMREAAPLMAARGGGRIVNVCLLGGQAPVADQPGLRGHEGGPAVAVARVRRPLRRRWRARQRRGARRRVVAAVDRRGGLADQAAGARGISRDEALAGQAAKIPLGRFAAPEEIASVIVFLCSEQASTVTGAAWSADGGTFASII